MLLLIAALLLVFLNGFFVAAEFAIVKIRQSRLEELVELGRPGAQRARHIVHHLDAYLSATQIGITLASLGLGWIGEPAVAHLVVEPILSAMGLFSETLLHTTSITIAFLFISFLHVVLGELAPKSLAIQRPEQTTLGVALPLQFFYYLFLPFIWVFNGSANFLLKTVGITPVGGHDLAHSSEEIRYILDASERGGILSKERHHILEGALDMANRTVRQIMMPRMDVTYILTTATWQEILGSVIDHGYSRFPLCEGDLDHPVGLLYAKDLLPYLAKPERLSNQISVVSFKRDVLFVPESQSVEVLLRQFRRSHIHMAIVVDEYGGTSGIVTLEDVIEELVGEIQDETDKEQPLIEKTPEGHYKVSGQLLVDRLEDMTNIAFPEPKKDTLGGYVFHHLGRIAVRGDEVMAGGHKLRVLETYRQRIVRVLVIPEIKQADHNSAKN